MNVLSSLPLIPIFWRYRCLLGFSRQATKKHLAHKSWVGQTPRMKRKKKKTWSIKLRLSWHLTSSHQETLTPKLFLWSQCSLDDWTKSKLQSSWVWWDESELVLANFLSTWHNPQSFGKRGLLIEKMPHQTGLWASVWYIFIIDNWWERAQLTVSGMILEL